MRFRLLGMIGIGLILSGCNWSIKKSGVEIISYPSAKVVIEGKDAGMTPYKNNSLKSGEMEIKLSANGREWSKKIHLESGANTVINREFGTSSQASGGYTLYFESTGNKKKAGILISTTPDRATLKIDDEVKGLSPLRIEDVGEGDKKITISYPGYKSLSSFVKFINGYQLVVEADLAKEEIMIKPQAEATNESVATESATKAITLIIQKTETGWLRVRREPNANGSEVARIKPNEEYRLLEEKEGWYKIDLGAAKTGWISSKYALKK